MKKTLSILLLFSLLLSGCARDVTAATTPAPTRETVPPQATEAVSPQVTQAVPTTVPAALPPETLPPETEPAAPTAPVWELTAPGTAREENEDVIIDYSNAADGYVMVCYRGITDRRVKAQVKHTTTYTFNLTPGRWTAFPLAEGDGAYRVTVYRNIGGTKYAAVLAATVDVTLSDPFAPFLRPNQYVDFSDAPNTVAQAAELCEGLNTLEKVSAVYDFVIHGLHYDHELAQTVQSGYLPELDQVLETGSGICFDYAALMTGMLRSQGVPCKLVVGYAGSVYHAWISVWSEETGWIEGIVFFDGEHWQRMDPTFASSAQGDEAILAYIGDGKNYTAKYIY